MAEKEPMNISAIVNGFESPNIPQISQPNNDDKVREIPHIDLTSSQEGRKKSIEGLITMADNNNSIPTDIDSNRNGSTGDIEYDSGKIEETFTISFLKMDITGEHYPKSSKNIVVISTFHQDNVK